ncbi:uncharacterized protein BX664DRAFT_343628 [Halteromyces radiatus]|uniref:uncharacterized protein n=1 Tax=Halteromyces radiatus TaxID=101107 RepID=UPI0022201937|nr:uncharacterized protein BX664DRAFT_343628 [Halteromyces radiatus]KAI8077843.1 hypothetical protein BX664DRAFT_343628 [Halteromyces radiatus]
MATKSIPEDFHYYIRVDTEAASKRRRLHTLKQLPVNSTCESTTLTAQQLAHTWLATHEDDSCSSDLLATMARLQRQLLFSIDEFVLALNLFTMSQAQLTLLLVSYWSWSRKAYGMMPLISFLLPLLHQSSSSMVLVACLQELDNILVVQDYLEAIITLMTTSSSSVPIDKAKVQQWMQLLFDQDRLVISNYSPGIGDVKCSSVYLAYFDLLADMKRLKHLSWQERKQWIEKEWIHWIPTCHDHQSSSRISKWIPTKSQLFSDQSECATISLLQEKNSAWLDGSHNTNDDDTVIPFFSSMFDFLMTQYSKDKIPNLNVMFGIFGHSCWKLVKTGQDSTQIVKILEQARQALLQHIQGPTEPIALLLSMVQISLHHFQTLLTYPQWFVSTFIDPDTSCLKTKRQNQLWMKHLETMIPYETPAILQIHTKAYADQRKSPTPSYVSQAKSRLLALGIDVTFKHYPTLLGSCNDSSNNNNIKDKGKGKLVESSSNNKTVLGHQPEDLQRLVTQFGDTNVIPQSLWEDSIFRPKWFKQTFLPALMLHWQPSDRLTLDRRDQLVAIFNNKGKIPALLYSLYTSTKQENKKNS